MQKEIQKLYEHLVTASQQAVAEAIAHSPQKVHHGEVSVETQAGDEGTLASVQLGEYLEVEQDTVPEDDVGTNKDRKAERRRRKNRRDNNQDRKAGESTPMRSERARDAVVESATINVGGPIAHAASVSSNPHDTSLKGHITVRKPRMRLGARYRQSEGEPFSAFVRLSDPETVAVANPSTASPGGDEWQPQSPSWSKGADTHGINGDNSNMSKRLPDKRYADTPDIANVPETSAVSALSMPNDGPEEAHDPWRYGRPSPFAFDLSGR